MDRISNYSHFLIPQKQRFVNSYIFSQNFQQRWEISDIDLMQYQLILNSHLKQEYVKILAFWLFQTIYPLLLD
jgi:hypothetical protein